MWHFIQSDWIVLFYFLQIFPSEFGKQRLAEEESQGPQELTEVKLEDGAEEEDLAVDKEGRTESSLSQFHV